MKTKLKILLFSFFHGNATRTELKPKQITRKLRSFRLNIIDLYWKYKLWRVLEILEKERKRKKRIKQWDMFFNSLGVPTITGEHFNDS
jgi:hypothetical protein